MNDKLQIVKSARFGNVQCDFYQKGKDILVTREQIGRALDYGDPNKAISNIHARFPERMSKYSTTLKLRGVDGKLREQTLYPRKGIMEICRHSNQPKADEFMDFTWEVMDSLMTGKAKIVSMTEYQQMIADTRQRNVRIQEARILNQMAGRYQGTTYEQVLHAHATKALTGDFLLPLPQLAAKTYTAAEIGESLGISANKVGTLTNRHNLKTDTYGEWFKDKSPYSNKEVNAFRYFDTVIPVLRQITEAES